MHTNRFRISIVASIALVLQACVGTPHKSAEEVTAAEVAVYKLGMSAGCRDAGRSKGESPEKNEQFCGCVAKGLESSVSESEWKQATYFAQQRRDADEQRVLGPHVRRLVQCRAMLQ